MCWKIKQVVVQQNIIGILLSKFLIYKDMKTYESFITPTAIGKLTIEVDDNEYDENWKYSLDLSELWEQYTNNGTTLLDFNNQYADLLMEKQQNISIKIGDSCWNEIEPLIADELRKATNEEQSETIYNKLYDIFDKYEIYVNMIKNTQN